MLHVRHVWCLVIAGAAHACSPSPSSETSAALIAHARRPIGALPETTSVDTAAAPDHVEASLTDGDCGASASARLQLQALDIEKLREDLAAVTTERNYWKSEAERMQGIAKDLAGAAARSAAPPPARRAAAPSYRAPQPAHTYSGPWLTVVGDQVQISGGVYNPSDDWAEGVVELELFIDGRSEGVERTEPMRLPPGQFTDYAYLARPFAIEGAMRATARWIDR
jgi:hypothetical protein